MTQRRRAAAGFTLLETLVAFVLVALTLGAAYASWMNGSRAAARAEEVLSALTRAENALARVGAEIPLTPGETVLRDGAWLTAIDITPHAAADPAADAVVGLTPYLVRVRVEAPSGGATVLETLRLGAVQ